MELLQREPESENDSDLGFVDESPDSAEVLYEDHGSDDSPEPELLESAPERPGDHEPEDSGDVSDVGLVDVSPLASDQGPVLVEPPLPGVSPAKVPAKIVVKPKAKDEPAKKAVRRIEIPATGTLATYATCPACEARNPPDSLRCGRCAEEIPSAIPTHRSPGRRAIQLGQARRANQEGVAAELLPEHVREQIAAAKQASEEHTRAAVVRRESFRRTTMAAVAAVFGLGSLLSLSTSLGWLGALWVIADGAIGAGLGHGLIRSNLDRLRCGALFSVAAGASTVIKSIVILSQLGQLAVGFVLPGLVAFTGLAFLTGFFVTMTIESRVMDQQL
ncbi:MAG TPA: hypothetical protein DEA08_39405 [Planctomycetes bacterium]|nr:hypothetical protein [Planctomycetota bacterium]